MPEEGSAPVCVRTRTGRAASQSLNGAIKIDEREILAHLDEQVRQSVEQTLNQNIPRRQHSCRPYRLELTVQASDQPPVALRPGAETTAAYKKMGRHYYIY